MNAFNRYTVHMYIRIYTSVDAYYICTYVCTHVYTHGHFKCKCVTTVCIHLITYV